MAACSHRTVGVAVSRSPASMATSVSGLLATLTGPLSPTNRAVALRAVRRVRGKDCTGLTSDMHPVLQRIYAARRIRSASDLDVSLERLHPVGTLEGIHAAVDLLLEHRIGGLVLVVGDFDADGATSTALMIRALTA